MRLLRHGSGNAARSLEDADDYYRICGRVDDVNFGDISTLAEPSVVDEIVHRRRAEAA